MRYFGNSFVTDNNLFKRADEEKKSHTSPVTTSNSVSNTYVWGDTTCTCFQTCCRNCVAVRVGGLNQVSVGQGVGNAHRRAHVSIACMSVYVTVNHTPHYLITRPLIKLY